MARGLHFIKRIILATALLVALPVTSMAGIWQDHPVVRYYQVTKKALDRLKSNFPNKEDAFIGNLKKRLIEKFPLNDVHSKLVADILASLHATEFGPEIYNENSFDDKLRKFLDDNKELFPEESGDSYNIQILKRIFEYRHEPVNNVDKDGQQRRLPFNEVFLQLLPARRSYIDSFEEIKNSIRSHFEKATQTVSKDWDIRNDVRNELGNSKTKFQGLASTLDNFMNELSIAMERSNELESVSDKIDKIWSGIPFSYLVYVQISYQGDKDSDQALKEAEESIKSYGKSKMLSDYSNLKASLDRMMNNKSAFPPIPEPGDRENVLKQIEALQSTFATTSKDMHGDFTKKSERLRNTKKWIDDIAETLKTIQTPPQLLPYKGENVDFEPEIELKRISVPTSPTRNASYYEDFDFETNSHIVHAFYTIKNKSEGSGKGKNSTKAMGSGKGEEKDKVNPKVVIIETLDKNNINGFPVPPHLADAVRKEALQVKSETDFASAIDDYRRQSVNWIQSAGAFVMHANAAAELGKTYVDDNKAFAESRDKLVEKCRSIGNTTSDGKTTNGATDGNKPTGGANPAKNEITKDITFVFYLETSSDLQKKANNDKQKKQDDIPQRDLNGLTAALKSELEKLIEENQSLLGVNLKDQYTVKVEPKVKVKLGLGLESWPTFLETHRRGFIYSYYGNGWKSEVTFTITIDAPQIANGSNVVSFCPPKAISAMEDMELLRWVDRPYQSITEPRHKAKRKHAK